jgi:hypothetical protein
MSQYRGLTGQYVRPSIFGRIAQLVEQLTLNQRVLGSIPSAPTILEMWPRGLRQRFAKSPRYL